MVRVRIAPSPTGVPHIGNTRTAFFNYLFARHNKGKFIVRIEDTDQTRIVPGAEEAIYEILEWLELKWDGEPYKQSEHLDEYKKHVDTLLKKGSAYKDEGAIRFKMPKEGETFWDDSIGKKNISFKNETQEDFVILKSDGFPTYHLANVVDDHLMNISHVIRGDEWISSTPKHILLYEAFGWELPVFAHLPVILGPDKTKLSKRHGAKSVLDYKKEGYLKEALLNFMGLLGWNPGGDKEVMGVNEMIKLFDLRDVNTASPIFDVKKLDWINGEYIRQTQNSKLKTQIADFFKDDREVLDVIGDENADKIIELAKTRMRTLVDFKNLVVSKKPKLSALEKNIAKTLLEAFSTVSTWNKVTILNRMKETLRKHNAKGNILYKIVTGFESGLPLPETLEILGKEKTLERIKSAID